MWEYGVAVQAVAAFSKSSSTGSSGAFGKSSVGVCTGCSGAFSKSSVAVQAVVVQ